MEKKHNEPSFCPSGRISPCEPRMGVDFPLAEFEQRILADSDLLGRLYTGSVKHELMDVQIPEQGLTALLADQLACPEEARRGTSTQN
jgi:hypothetical protein